MKLAVITDEISQDLDHALDVMAEYGVTGAEIRGTWGVNISDADLDLLQRIKISVKNHNATVVGIATPFYKCDLPGFGGKLTDGKLHGAEERTFDEQIAVLKRCIKAAIALETVFIRVFTFWKHGDLTSEVEDAIVKSFEVPAKLAESAGVTLLVENEHACFTGAGADTARLLARIGSQAVRSVWDPGNAFMASEVPYPDGYEAIKKYVSHVHVKDASAAKEWTVVGQGEIDWAGQLRSLKRDGYTGYLSLETHYSGGGSPEQSSRQCLDGLLKLMAQLD